MAEPIDHFLRPSATEEIKAMKENATNKNIPIPAFMNSGWGRRRVLCPGCTVDLKPTEYVGHYERRHGIIEEE